MVLEGMTDRPFETGRCYIMDMNVENTKVMKTSWQSFPIQMMIIKKQLENVENFKSLSSIQIVHMIINPGFTWKKQHSKRRRLFITSNLDINWSTKLVTCHIWSITLFGAETWILWQVLKCGAGKGWERLAGLIMRTTKTRKIFSNTVYSKQQF